ncbi:ABC transporter substrate-binding protein [Phycisphaeraceae bacterium D3-23]
MSRRHVTKCNARRARYPRSRSSIGASLPIGPAVILAIALASTLAVLVWPRAEREGLTFWTFAQHHARMYNPVIDAWNADLPPDDPRYQPVVLSTISTGALAQRTQAGFWAQTPTADLVEVEQPMMGRFAAGPVEDIGFYDLTDIIKQEGIDQRLNPASFAPWTSRGRIFGLPHDVHPVLLCYRADLVEAAGIDVNDIETWDDFERLMRPLIADLDDNGTSDRYLLGLWYTSLDDLQVLLLQAGGGTFDTDGNSLIASDANVQVIARVVSWCLGPDRIAIDAPEFSPSGNQLKLEGRVVAALMPDWLAGVWIDSMPALGGKLKLMPIPAWEPGGRRTSVRGGTMIAIPKTTSDFDAAWTFAKELYLSTDLARELFVSNHIISPMMDLWDEPYYAEPSDYFSGQQSGLAFIEQALDVPPRSSSPYHQIAMQRILDTSTRLHNYAQDNDVFDADALEAEAKRLLEATEAIMLQEMERNVFIAGGTSDE